jgi:hypothetical protein
MVAPRAAHEETTAHAARPGCKQKVRGNRGCAPLLPLWNFWNEDEGRRGEARRDEAEGR